MNIEELRKRRKEISSSSENTLRNMDKIANEAVRVAGVAHNSREIIDNLDEEFEKQTGLDSMDVKFLFFATALQVARWVLISKISSAVDKKISDSRVKDNDSSIKRMEQEKRNNYKEKHDVEKDGNWEHKKSEKYRTWLEIVYDGVPYDVTIGSPRFGINMEAGYHRIHTLGHDPIAGWLFGTINIISDTITLEDFRTYKIANEPRPKHWDYQMNIGQAFMIAIESIKEDDKRLPAAIFAQALHLKSDVYTKNGLPAPLLETFAPDLAGKLYREGYDSLCLMKDIAVVGTQAVVAILINMIITLIHGLYYNPVKYSSRDVYEVKTRKIVLYSNMISSASNLIWVGGNALAGNESAIKDLDVGGLMVTIYRLVTDTEYIRKVKEEFIFGSFRNMIKGDDLDLKEVSLWGLKE